MSLSSCSGIKSMDVLHLIEKCIGLEHVELDGHPINAASIAAALKAKEFKKCKFKWLPKCVTSTGRKMA